MYVPLNINKINKIKNVLNWIFSSKIYLDVIWHVAPFKHGLLKHGLSIFNFKIVKFYSL